MNNKNVWLIFIALSIILTGAWWVMNDNDDRVGPLPTTVLQDRVVVTTPLSHSIITSPLIVRGEAPGPWYFEASFPIELLDENGQQLAIAPAQATEDWMTIEQVPFEVTLTFTPPSTNTGTLILHRDNPSGLPEHDAAVRIPIRFR